MCNHQSSRQKLVRRWRRIVYTSSVLAAFIVIAAALGWHAFRTRHDRAALKLLQSASGIERREGAWHAANHDAPRALVWMARRLYERSEEDPDARESYAHALGRGGDPTYFDVVERVAQTDPDGYVCQSAWLATARLDADRFAAVAEGTPPRDDPWEQSGRAAAWLEIGDVRGVDDLLHWAVAGTEQQARPVSLALTRGLAPLLEAVGRWPSEYDIREGNLWPAALVAEVQRRCRTLDLQAIADDTLRHRERTARVQRNVGRMNRAREHVVRYLLDP